MSLISPVVERFDITDRTIWILPEVTSFHPIDDIMAEYVNARKNNDFFLQHDYAFMETSGGENKNPEGTRKTDRFLRLLKGAKYIFQDGSEEIEVTGETITDTGYNPFDFSQVKGKKTFTPYVPKTEVIVPQISSGGNVNIEQVVSETLKQVLCGNG